MRSDGYAHRAGVAFAAIWLVAAACLSIPHAAQAQAPQTIEPADPVARLLADLRDDDWRVRQRAQDELIALGPDVRARVAESLQAADTEDLRTRLLAALRQIDEVRYTGPSIVSLRLHDVHPRDALLELARQSSTDIRTALPTLWETRSFPNVSIDADRKPFWNVFRDICEQAGLFPTSLTTDRALLMDARDPAPPFGGPHVCVSGPFLISLSHISRTQSVDLNLPQNIRRDMRMQFMVYPEPKLRVLQSSPNARLTEALDDKGNSILPTGNYSDYLQVRTDWICAMTAFLQPKADTGRRLASLKGTTRIILQTRSQTAEIPDILDARNVSKSVDGRRFVLKEVRLTNGVYVVQLTLYRAGWSPSEWNYLATYSNSTFRLEDAKGVPLLRSGVSPGGGADQVELTLQFRRQDSNGNEVADEPAKLVWEIPTETREITVPFEFTDIALP